MSLRMRLNSVILNRNFKRANRQRLCSGNITSIEYGLSAYLPARALTEWQRANFHFTYITQQ